MATELENLVPEADVEVEGMRGPKGDKGDSYVLTEADKEEIARKVDTIIDAETDKSLTISGKPADAKATGDAIDDVKADLSENSGMELIQLIGGYYIDCSSTTVDINNLITSATGYGYAVVDCVEGDKFTLNVRGGSTPRAWCFISNAETGNRIDVAPVNTTLTNAVITAPAGATKLIINSNISANSYKGTYLSKQITELDSKIAKVNDNILDYHIVKGEYLAGGTITRHGAFSRSEPIPTEGFSYLIVNVKGQRSSYCGFFESDDIDVGSTALRTFGLNVGTNKVAIPTDISANYVVISNYNADLPKMEIFNKTGVELSGIESELETQAEYNGVISDRIKNQVSLVGQNFNPDGILYLNPADFVIGQISQSGKIQANTKRLASGKRYKFSKAVVFTCISPCKIYLNLYNNDGTYKSTTGWVGNYKVSANTEFMIMISMTGGSDESKLDTNSIPTYLQSISYYFEMDRAYYGDAIIPKKHGYNVTQLAITPSSTVQNYGQGLAVYDNTIFQICGNYNGVGHISLIDIATGTTIDEIEANVGHGGDAFFTDEFYDSGDSYPLIGIIKGEYPIPSIAFYRVTTSATLIKTYKLTEDAGYAPSCSYDPDTKYIYTTGYTNQDFQTADNNNKTIVCIYDANDLTETESGVYEPNLILKYQLPFIYCIQATKFYKGKLLCLSSYAHAVQKTWIYIVDPFNRVIKSIMKDFGVYISDWEAEGIDIVDDEWMLIGTRPRYFRLDFED